MTAVPALKRGFEILKLLNQHEALSLEQIAAATDYPKASLLRLLETMGEIGVVSKSRENKQYRATSLLMPRQHSFQQQLFGCLNQLAEQTNACVEWYQQAAAGMTIVQRFSAPENELQVQARLGFVRPWFEELEAVSLIALAFTQKINEKPKDQQMWRYDQEGERAVISSSMLKGLLKSTKQEALSCDSHYNDHGVKRMAAPILSDRRLEGIVAVAMSYRPQLKKQLPLIQTHLTKAINQLQH